MGVLKTLTDEYFGDSIRKEDEINISGLDVEIVKFKDNNGVEHKHGYRVIDGDSNEMAKTLKTLIERIIEERGLECSLNDIDVSNIKKMCYKEDKKIYGVFQESDFNGDISGWDVSNVEDMRSMFYLATSFNKPLNKWDVSRVEDMFGMFSGATSFNQPLDKWGDKLLNVKNMNSMFFYANSFNQDISGWDVSKVENMNQMFWYATSFNQDISKWDVSNVENMSHMFDGAISFNQDISRWDVSKVEDMSYMFSYAESFNQDISGWDVSNVENISYMFNSTPLKRNNKLPKWYLDRQ